MAGMALREIKEGIAEYEELTGMPGVHSAACTAFERSCARARSVDAGAQGRNGIYRSGESGGPRGAGF